MTELKKRTRMGKKKDVIMVSKKERKKKNGGYVIRLKKTIERIVNIF